jgi:hypothetical protein
MLTSYNESLHVSPGWCDAYARRQASKGSNAKCACGSHWGQCSTRGTDLDSLDDRLSFGIAPAVLGLSLRLRGLWSVVALSYEMPWPIARWHRSLPSWPGMPLLLT